MTQILYPICVIHGFVELLLSLPPLRLSLPACAWDGVVRVSLLPSQGNFEHLVHVLHGDDLQILTYLLGHIHQVFHIFLWDKHHL